MPLKAKYLLDKVTACSTQRHMSYEASNLLAGSQVYFSLFISNLRLCGCCRLCGFRFGRVQQQYPGVVSRGVVTLSVSVQTLLLQMRLHKLHLLLFAPVPLTKHIATTGCMTLLFSAISAVHLHSKVTKESIWGG